MQTPRVNIRFENNNIQSIVPSIGISHVVARTTKGPFNDPSTLINANNFAKIFGSEIVPDGTASNIERALSSGSQLRISRVSGANSPTKGVASVSGKEVLVKLTFTNPENSEAKTATFGFATKEYGYPINGASTGVKLKLVYSALDNGTLNYQVQQLVGTTPIEGTALNILQAAPQSADRDDLWVGSTVFGNFIENVENIEIDETSIILSDWPSIPPNPTKYDLLNFIGKFDNYYKLKVETSIDEGTTWVELTSSLDMDLPIGSDGGASSATTWNAAFDALDEYFDSYQLILSHIEQHLTSTAPATVYSHVAPKILKNFETVWYVEIPKSNNSPAAIKTWVSNFGFGGKNIALFAGGLKYGIDGIVRDNDVLGTVLGLGDTNAVQNGPWSSFAGMNRGTVSAVGPVMKNLGSPNDIEELEKIAQINVNLFVNKNTRYGNQTMLWHHFTTEPKPTSDRFLTITRLNLYLKKNIRPILESYIEEPNTFSTWRSIFYNVNPILTELVSRNALLNPQWFGDQDAASFADLQVNNEADVRAGKYKAILRYTDIVTLQIIDLLISINKVSNTTEITL